MVKKVLKENWGYLTAIVLFILFALIVKNLNIYKYILDLDYTVIVSLNNIVTSHLTSMFKFITFLGDWYVPVILLILILIFQKNKKYSIVLGVNYILAFALSFLTKILIARPRPSYALIEFPDKYSFPSGHTLTSIVFYIMLYYLMTKMTDNQEYKIIIGALIILLLILIAFSRVYLGVHYLSDVIGGIILGTLFVSMNINIIRKNYLEKLK